MFFIIKSATWLAIGFLIVRPAIFDDAISDPGNAVKQGAIQAVQIAGVGLEQVAGGQILTNEAVKFCLDRKELCTQTTAVIGEMIVGSVSSMHQKEHTKRNGFSLKGPANNKEPFLPNFVPVPRLRPGTI